MYYLWNAYSMLTHSPFIPQTVREDGYYFYQFCTPPKKTSVDGLSNLFNN